jgi:hypothetical protein
MVRVYVVATTVALFVANWEPSFAAQRARQASDANSRNFARENRGVTGYAYNPSRIPPFDYRNGTSNYPFGPGYNLPYPDRPYGAPGRW